MIFFFLRTPTYIKTERSSLFCAHVQYLLRRFGLLHRMRISLPWKSIRETLNSFLHFCITYTKSFLGRKRYFFVFHVTNFWGMGFKENAEEKKSKIKLNANTKKKNASSSGNTKSFHFDKKKVCSLQALTLTGRRSKSDLFFF